MENRQEKVLVVQYGSPRMELFVNSFANWLVKREGGRLPAPRLGVIGASEDIWRVLYETRRRTGGQDHKLEDWLEKADAASFPFLAVEDGRLCKLDKGNKRTLLPWLFPFYPRGVLKTMAPYDAAIFLRLAKLSEPRHQLLVAAYETGYVVAVWLGRNLTDGSDRETAVAALVEQFLTENQSIFAQAAGK